MVKFSVVIPVCRINSNIKNELIPAFKRQTFKDFELIIVPDKKSKKYQYPKWVKIISSFPKTGPANKRDLGVKMASGEIMAFIDDDAFPSADWLKNALVYFDNQEIAGVCGPGLTPSADNWKQKVSGWVWSTWLGAGGAGVYRNKKMPKKEVDDFPSFNLIVRKKDFEAVGGFDSHFWPGEDTKLCHELRYKLLKKIIYDPEVFVFHHRRQIFLPHLQQISRFAVHRGHFARILPKTSFKLGYFLPSIFAYSLILTPFFIAFFELFSLCFISISLLITYIASVILYLMGLMLAAIYVFSKERNLKISLYLIPAIFLTHTVYGLLFIKGFVARRLDK